jgi:iron complex outermembrane recepter protein
MAGVLHRISATGSIFQLNSKNAYAFSSFAGFAGSLYDPTEAPPPVANFFTGGTLYQPLTTSRVKTSSLALADMLSFADDEVRLMLGGRLQRIAQYSYDYNTGNQLSGYDKKSVTPAVGLVVKPSRLVSSATRASS